MNIEIKMVGEEFCLVENGIVKAIFSTFKQAKLFQLQIANEEMEKPEK